MSRSPLNTSKFSFPCQLVMIICLAKITVTFKRPSDINTDYKNKQKTKPSELVEPFCWSKCLTHCPSAHCLTPRMSEHMPKRLSESTSQCPATSCTETQSSLIFSIATFLVTSGHEVGIAQSFKLLLRNTNPIYWGSASLGLTTLHQPAH